MSSDEAAKKDWLQRVLGMQFTDVGSRTAPPRGPAPIGAKLLPIWNEAKEAVDAGIGKLQDVLRATGDEDLEQIAEFGLFGASKGQTVRLVAALHEADSGNPAARGKVIDAVQSYRDFLDGAPIVDLIENNPFGVTVPMRATLGGALKELERLAAV